jgi:hypothetical protein
MRFLLVHDGHEVGFTPDLPTPATALRFFEFDGTVYAVLKTWIRATSTDAVQVLEVVPKADYLDPAFLDRFRQCRQAPASIDLGGRRRMRRSARYAA